MSDSILDEFDHVAPGQADAYGRRWPVKGMHCAATTASGGVCRGHVIAVYGGRVLCRSHLGAARLEYRQE